MKKIIASIALGFLIYRLLLMLQVMFLNEFLDNLGFVQIIPSLVLSFFVGLLVAFMANSNKNYGWLYGIVVIIIDQFVKMLTPYFVGYSLYESFITWKDTFLIVILILILAALGGKCGDIIRNIMKTSRTTKIIQ